MPSSRDTTCQLKRRIRDGEVIIKSEVSSLVNGGTNAHTSLSSSLAFDEPKLLKQVQVSSFLNTPRTKRTRIDANCANKTTFYVRRRHKSAPCWGGQLETCHNPFRQEIAVESFLKKQASKSKNREGARESEDRIY
jgi:hypothetical protein